MILSKGPSPLADFFVRLSPGKRLEVRAFILLTSLAATAPAEQFQAEIPLAAERQFELEVAAASLQVAEKAYAKMGAEKGFRAASLANFADDAVIFAPGMINGKKFWTEAKEDPVINWGPSFVAIARSGELGYTTGPAVYLESRKDPKPVGYGHFVSVWKKNSEGIWKVMVDVGVNHTEPSERPGQEWGIPKSPLAHPECAAADLEKAQFIFSEGLKKDEGAAILGSASDDIRVYRRGAVPLVGKAAAAQGTLGSEHGKTSRTRIGGGLSKASDLAYEYGEYSSDRDGVGERGIYFCIWRLDTNWRLVVDLQKKAPTEKK